jgi:hypothetical protein
MKNKIYISGGISGRPIEEAEAHFAEAEKKWVEQGCEVVNPCTLPHNHGRTWLEFMKEDVAAMMQCDAIYMLTGWRKSRGAVVEYIIAQQLEYRVLFEDWQDANKYYSTESDNLRFIQVPYDDN